MKRLSFHIQQNLTPARLKAVLRLAGDSAEGVEQVPSEIGLAPSVIEKVVLPFVRQSGLLESRDMSLTALGRQFEEISQHSEMLLAEAMHHLLYTTHAFHQDRHFSWAYARVVDALWASGERVLDGNTNSELVSIVVEGAARGLGVPVQQIAFSHDSVRGVLNWLQALDPPIVIVEGKRRIFRRRYFCPVPAFLWAADFLYRVNNIAYGVRMSLTSERTEQLCKICVLDPSGLDNVLMMAKRTSDFERSGVFDYGTEGGFGRWFLLLRQCSVPTLPERAL